MISKTMQTILHALSYGNIEVEASRRLADIKKLDAMRIFLKKLDTKVYNGTYEVPVRLYFPNEESMGGDVSEKGKYPVLLFFHGGAIPALERLQKSGPESVVSSIDNYLESERLCAPVKAAAALS